MNGRGMGFRPFHCRPFPCQVRLFRVPGVAGQNCECFLDRTSMRVPALPLRRDETLQRLAVPQLGLDPESPLIKSEIAAGLARGPNPNASPTGLAARSRHRPAELSAAERPRTAIARAAAAAAQSDPRRSADGQSRSRERGRGLPAPEGLPGSGGTVLLVPHGATVEGMAGRMVEMRSGKIPG